MSKKRFFTSILLVLAVGALFISGFLSISSREGELIRAEGQYDEGQSERSEGNAIDDSGHNLKPEDFLGDDLREDEKLLLSIRKNFSLNDEFFDHLTRIVSPVVGTFQERHRAVRELTGHLDPEEVRAIFLFLSAAPPEGRRERIHDRAIKNDILNQLRNQDEAPHDLTGLMVRLFDDTRQDGAVRDYALQHLRAWYSKAPDEERPLIVETLVRGMEETEGSTSGTALLSLRHLKNFEGVPNIAEAAREMIQREHLDDLSQVTAMQVAADSVSDELMERAVQWALDPSSSYSKRASAIAALGSIGSEEAVAVLSEIAAMDDEYLKPAIDAAYDRLRRVGFHTETSLTR